MKSKGFIIKHPFFINEKSEINLEIFQDDILYTFDSSPLAAKIQANEFSLTNTHIYLIELSEDTNIFEITNEMVRGYEFTKCCDLVLPMDEESKNFYTLFDKITTSTAINLLNGNEENNLISLMEKEKIPYAPPNILSLSNAGNFINKADLNDDESFNVSGNKSTSIIITDDPPMSPEPELYNNFKKYITKNETCQAVINGLEKIQANDVIKSSELHKLIKDNNLNISVNLLKRGLGLFYYYYKSGPFSRCWVKFGIDLRKNSDSYIYQTVQSKNKKVNVYLKDHKDIIREVEKNRNWYILPTFSNTLGWVSEALRKYIAFYYSTNSSISGEEEKEATSNIQEEFKSDEFLTEEEFEIFD